MSTRDPMRDIAEEVARITAENARLLGRLGAAEQRFRLISRGVLRVQESERGRISRDLHDGVGQSLTALKIQIELLAQAASSTEHALAARLAELRDLADQTLQEVRQISHLLRPQMLDDLGLMPTLRWLARTFHKRTGVDVQLTSEGMEERLDPDMETLVFRLVQEALTNVAKHAHAPAARVDVRRTDGRLRVRVEDDGAGFDASAALAPAREEDRGFGLRGMRDRVHLFGGRLDLRSAPGEGTAVNVEVPLAHEPPGGPA